MNKIINAKWCTKIALLLLSLINLAGCSSIKEQSQSYSNINMYLPDFNGVAKNKTADLQGNKVIDVVKQPLIITDSNFNVNSYTNMRRSINQNRQPPKDSLQLEGWINYFEYDYPQPQDDQLFSVTPEIAPTPWDPAKKLLRIGVQAKDFNMINRLPMNLVVLVDSTYVMDNPGGLPLIKTWLNALTQELGSQDKLTILTNSTHPRLVLKPTSGNDKKTIEKAIQTLAANEFISSTASIDLGYHLAQINFINEGTNHIVLANNGNLKLASAEIKELQKTIKLKNKEGFYFSTISFNFDNYDYQSMIQFADAGGGIHAYVDSIIEASKVVKKQLMIPMSIIAKNVELQVEFNSENVKNYRLLGYGKPQTDVVNRDPLYIGNIRSSYSFTALYEVTLTDTIQDDISKIKHKELAFIRTRYSIPNQTIDNYFDISLLSSHVVPSLNKTSNDFRFASAIAAFSQQLEDNKSVLNNFQLKDTIKLASKSKGDDYLQLRSEFIHILRQSEDFIH